MSPEEMISTDAGKILVENLIQRLEYGVFSLLRQGGFAS